MSKQNIAVVGAGSWGTALAVALAECGHDILMWAFEPEVAAGINENHQNPRYLRDQPLPKQIRATSDLAEAVAGRPWVVLVVPSHVLRGVAEAMGPQLEEGTIVVNASKGIENETLLTMSGVLYESLPERVRSRVVSLSGPSFAKDVAAGLPTAVVAACIDHHLAERAQALFTQPRLRVYSGHDQIGVELGGSLKNVIAIAAGVLDGMGMGASARAGMVTRGLNEIARLGVKMGGNPLTMLGLAGVGDLMLTCASDLSRNRQVGMRLGKGEKIDEILGSMDQVAEGVTTARSVHDLAEMYEVELPICEQVFEVLHQGKEPPDAIRALMGRSQRPEMAGLWALGG